MDIDPSFPWGVAIDYAGRATVTDTDSGHTIHIRIYDNGLNQWPAPDPYTGSYPPVTVSAEIVEDGDHFSELRGYGSIVVNGVGADPIVPDPTSVQSAVAAALDDFAAASTAYAALVTAWPPPAVPQKTA